MRAIIKWHEKRRELEMKRLNIRIHIHIHMYISIICISIRRISIRRNSIKSIDVDIIKGNEKKKKTKFVLRSVYVLHVAFVTHRKKNRFRYLLSYFQYIRVILFISSSFFTVIGAGIQRIYLWLVLLKIYITVSYSN